LKIKFNQASWCSPLIPALERHRQADCKFASSLGYIARSCLHKGREEGKEGQREGRREGGKEGRKKGGKEGREGGREDRGKGGKEGRKEGNQVQSPLLP
jgi:hypothetical protein